MYKNERVKRAVGKLYYGGVAQPPQEWNCILRAYRMTEYAGITNELVFDSLQRLSADSIKNLINVLREYNVSTFGVYCYNEEDYSNVCIDIMQCKCTITGTKTLHILERITGKEIRVPVTMFEIY